MSQENNETTNKGDKEMRINLHKLIKMQSGEKTALIVRKHWFIFIKDAFAIFFATLLLWTILGVLLKYAKVNDALVVFWQALTVIIGMLSLFVIWTNYYLDMWIVTNKRVIHIDQHTLFSRVVAATRIDRVQDVKAKVSGIIATMLGFGDLQVQTAGTETRPLLIKGIPEPNEVRRIILRYLDRSLSEYNHNL